MEVEHETPEKWQDELYDLLRRNRITQFADVPDAGHRILIDRSLADPGVHSVAPTSEEEGVALLAGADLGGARGVLLMQSILTQFPTPLLSLVKGGRFPLLTVFRDVHVSGAKTDRAQLRRVIDTLGPGDVLMVTRLDRLARSTRDLVNTLAVITERKAGFRSLADAWADTTTSHGRLMRTVLGGLAEFERDLIRARTAEGRQRAKARGVRLGRGPKLTAHQQQEARRRRESGEPIRDIARSYNVHNSTISRLTA